MSASKPTTPDAMMGALVMGNKDIVGLLAYAIYSQFRDEWRAGFARSFGREPTGHELAVYELGEQTSRRAMTYRFLADARVMGSYGGGTRGAATDAFVQKIYETGVRSQMKDAAGPRFSPMRWRTRAVFAIVALALGSALVVNLGRTGQPISPATATALLAD